MENRFKQSLCAVYQQIASAKNACGRQIEDIVLIAVSKKFPCEDIRQFYDLGQRDFGENYVQEWQQKHPRLPEDIVWHLIGHIQSNKSRAVAEKAHWLHTLDRVSLAERLNRQRPEHLPPLNICLEVNISQESQKHGILSTEIDALADAVAFLPRLRLRGLMCVPTAGDEKTVFTQMKQMQELFYRLQSRHEGIDTLSMGMSSDMEQAIACGATHVRIGSALFGSRT